MSPKHPLAKDSAQSPWHIGGVIVLILVLGFSIRLSRAPTQVVTPPGVPPALPLTQGQTYPTPYNPVPSAVPTPVVNTPTPVPSVAAPVIPAVQPTVPGQQVAAPTTQGSSNVPVPAVSNSLWKAIFPLNAVNAILALPDGTTWVAHEQGLARIIQNGMVNFTFQNRTFPSVNATSLAYDGRNVWVGTFDGLVQVSDGNTFRRFTTRDGLIHDMVWSLDWDGHILWIGTQAGVSFMTADGRFERIDKRISNGGLADIWIGAVRKIDRWVLCGNDDGLSIWDTAGFAANPGSWVTLDQFETNLVHNWVLGMTRYQDKLWIGTPQGLARLETSFDQLFQPGSSDKTSGPRSLFSTFNRSTGLPSDRVNALQPWKDALWLGTQAGLSRWQNGAIRTWTEADGLLANDVRAVADGGEGLWVGTSRGLQLLSATAL
ncbi:MAG TPA: hypothetical protein PKO06_07445 [Candidatus Ozemobacteraceae bacterium]|nr:hypothetical protein [Candidatus Ozemobacteraceae bacterium]